MLPPPQVVARDMLHSVFDGGIPSKLLEVVEESLEDNVAELGDLLGSGEEDKRNSLCKGVTESGVLESVAAVAVVFVRNHDSEVLRRKVAELVNLVLDCGGEDFRVCDEVRGIRGNGSVGSAGLISGTGVVARVREVIEVVDHQLDDFWVVVTVRVALVFEIGRQVLEINDSGVSFLLNVRQ